MKTKNLILISILAWANIGLYYILYKFEVNHVLVGVFKELTLIPSFLVGIICPIWLIVRKIIGKIK
jgi:hypothetical protein|tara:strand:+ start:350 stop:547 length:198 start_codon:yes stop_codon:yes gene_type:complete